MRAVVALPRGLCALVLAGCSANTVRPSELLAPAALTAQVGSVARSGNVIEVENRERGTTDWLLTEVEPVIAKSREGRYRRQRAIEGFVSHASIRAGEALTAYVSTEPRARYGVEVFRMGYYGGTGGRSLARLGPFEGVAQPEPVEG